MTTKVNRPQSNGIVERFHLTLLDEHFRVEGRRMNGRTPWQAFQEGLPRAAKTNTRAEQEERKAA